MRGFCKVVGTRIAVSCAFVDIPDIRGESSYASCAVIVQSSNVIVFQPVENGNKFGWEEM